MSILSFVALLTACGGGGKTSSSGPASQSSISVQSSSTVQSSAASSTSIKLMGGSVQGSSLNIGNAVTTLAGTLPNADGAGSAAGFNYPSGITSDGTNFYIVDTYNNKIRKISIATGVVSTLAGSGSAGSADGIGTAASFYHPEGITSDGTNLYVADTDNDKIRKILIATGEVTTFAGSGAAGTADGIGAAANFNSPHGITSDGANLYITDSGNHKIRKIVMATREVTSLAGTDGTGGFVGDFADGARAQARFNNPQGITSDGINLYVADTDNHRIRKIVIATGVVTTLAGSSTEDKLDGIGTAASFRYPQGITNDGTNLYITDVANHNVRKLVLTTGAVTTLAGSGLRASTDGTGTTANFNSPYDIISDDTNLFVTDRENHKVRKIVIATGDVTTLAGSSRSRDGKGTAASFNYPFGITSDGTNLYIADTQNNKIRKIAVATGEVTTLAGSGLYGSADGIGPAASFNTPVGITNDGTNLYVADSANHRIRKIVITTGSVTTLAGNGEQGNSDGIGTAARFAAPLGITTDGTNLYVADTSNHSIRKIVIATGTVTTLAGRAGLPGDTDGTGSAAGFHSPAGIATDGTNLYVADTYNHSIRKVVIATGVVTTLAGHRSEFSGGEMGISDYPELSTADGVGAKASFSFPQGIMSDGTNLYVADTLGEKIRKIVIATGEVSTIVGSDALGSTDGIGSTATFNRPSGITSDGFDLFLTDSNNNMIRRIH